MLSLKTKIGTVCLVRDAYMRSSERVGTFSLLRTHPPRLHSFYFRILNTSNINWVIHLKLKSALFKVLERQTSRPSLNFNQYPLLRYSPAACCFPSVKLLGIQVNTTFFCCSISTDG